MVPARTDTCSQNMHTPVDSLPPIAPIAQPTAAGGTSQATAESRKGARVLCADDSPLMREVYAHVLGHLGLLVQLADDGRTALDCYLRDAGGYSLVITDHEMPRMNGFELTQALRRAGYAGPICVASALDRRDTEHIYRDLNVDAVLQKPVLFDDLNAAVAHLLR